MALEPRQQRIIERLSRLIGPGAAAFFDDAVTLMRKPDLLRSSSHLVAHLLRETQSAMLDVLAPPQKAATANAARAAEAPPSTGPTNDDDEDAGLDHRTRVKFVLTRLGLSHTEQPGASWIRLADPRAEQSLATRAHRPGLDAARPIKEDFERMWSQVQFVFDSVLDAFEAKFDLMLDEVDELLKSRPSRKAAKKLRTRIPNTPTLRHPFFEKAGPEWFDALDREGLFEQPVDVSDDRLYRWCQSVYLKRMAGELTAQERVAVVLAGIRPTGSWRMSLDLTEAARALPAPLASGWIERQVEWLGQQRSFEGFLGEKNADLVASLATAGECNGAVRLAKALLTLAPDRTGNTRFSRLTAHALFDHSHYERIVKAMTPLESRCAWATFTMGIDVLLPAIAVRPETGVEDDSDRWCARIGEIGKHDDPVGGSLVKLILAAAQHTVEQRPAALTHVCERLRATGFHIFRRIELSLLAILEHATSETVKQVLMEPELMRSSTTWPEYRVLLQRRWDDLDESEHARILEWIETGPGDAL